MFSEADLFEFLEEKMLYYNRPLFFEADPVAVPHRFTGREDIEIAAFLTATISWGNRKSIISNAEKLMGYLENTPFDFITNASEEEIGRAGHFVHRTFNGTDAIGFIMALRMLYMANPSLEPFFSEPLAEGKGMQFAIGHFRQQILQVPHPARMEKHLANPLKNSAAKRINMFLRWMVRSDSNGVDFGLWNTVSPSELYCPLDVHTGTTARKLGLLTRKPNDWKAVEELTAALRLLDPSDPVKYDYALFGLGMYEKF